MKPIIFWGATGQAKVLREFVSVLGYELIALFDNNETVQSPFVETPIFHGRQGFQSFLERKHSDLNGAVAIGGFAGKDRLEIQRFFNQNGINTPVLIHPTAFVAGNAGIGNGSQILGNSAVGAEADLGEACIINTSASVDHECKLGKGVHIAPGAVLAGCIEVGDFSFIGTGAVVLPRIKIGSNVIVGAGAVVTKNVSDNVVVYGNPARIIKDN